MILFWFYDEKRMILRYKWYKWPVLWNDTVMCDIVDGKRSILVLVMTYGYQAIYSIIGVMMSAIIDMVNDSNDQWYILRILLFSVGWRRMTSIVDYVLNESCITVFYSDIDLVYIIIFYDSSEEEETLRYRSKWMMKKWYWWYW